MTPSELLLQALQQARLDAETELPTGSTKVGSITCPKCAHTRVTGPETAETGADDDEQEDGDSSDDDTDFEDRKARAIKAAVLAERAKHTTTSADAVNILTRALRDVKREQTFAFTILPGFDSKLASL